MLVGKLAAVYSSLLGQDQAPASRLWSSQEEEEAVHAAVAPKLAQAQEDVKRLLYEVVTLEVSDFCLSCLLALMQEESLFIFVYLQHSL